MQRIDRELWEKMLQLTEAGLQDDLGSWVGKPDIRPMIARRDKVQQVIAKMVASSGEGAVFIR